MNQLHHQEARVTRSRRNGGKLFLVFILLLLAALAVTNPNKQNFTEHLMNSSEDSKSGMFNDIVNSVGTTLLDSVTERDNYIFFSVYYYGDGQQGPKYIGFFKSVFIEI